MTDQDPPIPDPDRSGDGHDVAPPNPPGPADQAGGRNQWAFEAPDPSLSFHGDIPTDPAALEDRPTGAFPPPPASQRIPDTAVGGAAAAMPPPQGAPEGVDPAATRVVTPTPPLAAGTSSPGAPGAPGAKRVGGRTAAILVGVAALVGLAIVAALALTGGDDGEVVATNATPGTEPSTPPTPGPTPEEATPTPGPTATPQPPPSAATDLVATTNAFGGRVAERWELQDGRLTSTIEIANETDAPIAGLHVVVIPNSVTTDLATVAFNPRPVDEVAADDPAAAFAVELDTDDPPLTITWSADVELATGETPDEALDRLLGDRAAAGFRFASDGPDLTVNAPDDGSTTIGSSVTLRGQTDPDVTLTVAGERVAVDADNGRFRTEIERTRDRRELAVVATDPYGRTTELTWTVRFADPAPTPTPRPVAPPVVQPPQPQPPQPQPQPPTPAPPPQCDPLDESCR